MRRLYQRCCPALTHWEGHAPSPAGVTSQLPNAQDPNSGFPFNPLDPSNTVKVVKIDGRLPDDKNYSLQIDEPVEE